MQVPVLPVSRPRSDNEETELLCSDFSPIVPDDVADSEAYCLDSRQADIDATTLPEALLDLTGVTPHRQFHDVEFERWKIGQQLAAKLFSVGQDTLGQKLRDCHNERTTAICVGCSKRTVFWNRCDIFYCPQCSPRLAKLRLDNLMFFVEKMKQPKHIVLTLSNVQNLTRDYLRMAQKSLGRLRRLS